MKDRHETKNHQGRTRIMVLPGREKTGKFIYIEDHAGRVGAQCLIDTWIPADLNILAIQSKTKMGWRTVAVSYDNGLTWRDDTWNCHHVEEDNKILQQQTD